MEMSPFVTLDAISVRYGKIDALKDVSGVFHRGSLTAIAGPNGAGKSTLLKVIAGITAPSSGALQIKGEPRVGYLPQTSSLHRDFPFTVLQAAMTGLWPETGSFGRITPERKNKTLEALTSVGLNGLEEREISALSGGQFQRLLFARLMLQDADLLLLDEPFAAMDAETTANLIQLLLKWREAGKTIICVLHDLLLIRKYFPESFVLAGKCLGKGHTHALFEQKLLSFDLDMAELLPEDKHEHP